MLKELSNNLTWYKILWYNDLKCDHDKGTKNHSSKKAGKQRQYITYNNQIMCYNNFWWQTAS